MNPHAGSIGRATVVYRTADVKGIPWGSASSHLRCSSQTPARHSTLFRCFLHQPSPGQNEMVLANRVRKAGYFHNRTLRMRLRHWPLSMLAPDTSPSISSEIGSIYGTIKANMTSHSRAARVALPRPISLLMPRPSGLRCSACRTRGTDGPRTCGSQPRLPSSTGDPEASS